MIIKVISVILSMLAGSLVYQILIADTPNYMVTFDMIYWASVTAITFWLTGLLKTK